MKTSARRERTTANLARMAEDMGLDPIALMETPRQAVARVAGAIRNILDTELRRQVQAGGKYTLERGETSTGSELIRLDIDGEKYNITITRARK